MAAALADDQDVTELWTRWSPQLVTALGRIGGRTVGFVANQPQALAGTLDIAASQKGARFVRFCDSFNLPLVTLVDTPGFLPGKDLEWRGMIRHGAELAFAYAEATVPRVCVILRKAFGGAYIVMDSKGLGNDLCFAWPGAEIAVMGAEGAVQILHRRASARGAGGASGGVRRPVPHPVAGGRAGVRRCGDRPRRHPCRGGRRLADPGDVTGAPARAQAHGGAAVAGVDSVAATAGRLSRLSTRPRRTLVRSIGTEGLLGRVSGMDEHSTGLPRIQGVAIGLARVAEGQNGVEPHDEGDHHAQGLRK